MQKLKTKVLATVVAAFALTTSACASGGATAPATTPAGGASTAAPAFQLVTPGTLTACSDVPYPPFEIEDPSTPTGYSGFDIEIMDAIAKKLGLTFKVIDVEFNALQSGTVLVAGQCDMGASAMTITEERKKNIDFSDPYYDSLQSLLVRADSGITNLAGTAGKKIGVQAGTTGKSYTEKNKPASAVIVEFPSDGDLWPAIQARQIDVILQDLPVNRTHEKADANFKIVETYKTDEQYGFAFAKDKNPALLAAVNTQLKAMRADGTYDALYKKYFG
nr:transporter substrate-binding domain-containing protein [Propionibacterium sp.]